MKKTSHSAKLIDYDLDHLLHPQSNITDVISEGPRIMEQASGIRVKDANGNEVIDGLAGLWCVNVGYGREELAETMKEAAKNLSYFHSFSGMSNPPQVMLADKLASMAPGKLSRVFYGCSGSDANDTLMKIVWHYNYIKGRPEKKKIIARWSSYHGTSVSSASLTGLPTFHAPYNLPIPEVRHTLMPHYYRNAEAGESEEAFVKRMVKALEDMILEEGPDTVAAFIAEPVTGAGGVVAPPKGYFEAIQAVLKKYDVLMIADEVICGYGRLGKMWGSEVFNIQPDMMASAKGLTSGYFPLSAAYITDEIWQVLKEGSAKTGNFSHGYTYSGHPIGCAVALKNLEILEREKLVENVAAMGRYLHDQLEDTFGDNPHVGEIRGTGLIAGIQLILDKDNKVFFDPKRKIPMRIQQTAYHNGLICRNLPSVTSIALAPPFIVTKNDIDEIVGLLKKSFDEVMAGLSKEDLVPAD